MDQGKLTRFYSLDLDNNEDIVNAVLSSSAVPSVFPHIDWNDATYSDGGLMTSIDFRGAVEGCIDLGYA